MHDVWQQKEILERVFLDKDGDHDKIGDRLDKCPETPFGLAVDEDGCPLEDLPGDCDGDGDVDLDDFASFEACLLGPDGGLGTGCECFDFDGDGDNDLLDFAQFQVNFTGN